MRVAHLVLLLSLLSLQAYSKRVRRIDKERRLGIGSLMKKGLSKVKGVFSRKKKKVDSEDRDPYTARRLMIRRIESEYQAKVKAADRNLSKLTR